MAGRYLLALGALLAGLVSLPANAQIAGLVHDVQNGSLRAVSIHSATGAVTPGAEQILECCLLGAGLTATDTAGQRFFAAGRHSDGPLEDDSVIATLAFDGSAVNTATPDVAPQGLLAYDSQFDRLISLSISPGAEPEVQWLSIDPASGSVSNIGSALTTCCEFASGLATIDAASQALYFVGRPFGTSPWQLLRTDLSTGQVDEIAELPPGRAGFIAFDANHDQVDVLMQTAPADPLSLHRIDPTSGAISLLATHEDDDCCLLLPGAMASLDSNDQWWLGGSPLSPEPSLLQMTATTDSTAVQARAVEGEYLLHGLVVDGEVLPPGGIFQDRFEL